MAPVAFMLNLRAYALTAACSGDYQRGRPTTGSKQPRQTSHRSPMLAPFLGEGGGVGGEMPSHGSPMLVNCYLSETDQWWSMDLSARHLDASSGSPGLALFVRQVAACSAITASTPLWTYLFGNTGATPKWRTNYAVANFCPCSRCTATK